MNKKQAILALENVIRYAKTNRPLTGEQADRLMHAARVVCGIGEDAEGKSPSPRPVTHACPPQVGEGAGKSTAGAAVAQEEGKKSRSPEAGSLRHGEKKKDSKKAGSKKTGSKKKAAGK